MSDVAETAGLTSYRAFNRLGGEIADMVQKGEKYDAVCFTALKRPSTNSYPLGMDNDEEMPIALMHVFRDEMNLDTQFLLVTSGMCVCKAESPYLRSINTYCVDCLESSDLAQITAKETVRVLSAFDPDKSKLVVIG